MIRIPRLLSTSLTLVAVSAPALAQGHFADWSGQLGLGFQHFDTAFGYAMGGGAAWFDLENDGDEDLFAAGTDSRHAMFRNDGGGFLDIYLTSGLHTSASGSTIGVAAADYDSDGFVDLLLTNTGPNQLFRNLGNGTFSDLAQVSGLTEAAWSSSASWADFDLDGDLDLYVGNYVQTLNFPYHFGDPNHFYENQGNGQFVEGAAGLGIDNVGVFGPTVPGFPYIAPTGQATAGCTLSVSTLDWDEDGDPDLMVGNDFGQWVIPNTFYRNDIDLGAGLVFTDITSTTGFDTAPHYNMGINPGDYDHDGDWDLYLSNLGDNRLMRNDNGVFADVAAGAGALEGLNDLGTLLLSSWGTSFSDLDNDGWEDLLVSNGLIPAAMFILNEKDAENHILLNNHDGTFSRLDPVTSGMNDSGASRGIALTDFDSDGLLDFYVMNNGAAATAKPGDKCRFYHNEGTLAAQGAGWLELDLVGRFGNTQGIGARVDATDGQTTWKRQVLGDPVFASASSRMVHFGFGGAKSVDVTIDWPLGGHQELVGVPAAIRFEVLEPAVLLSSIDAPVWTGNSYVLTAHLENKSNQSDLVDLVYNLHLGASGPLVLSLPVQVLLSPGELRQVDFVLPVDAALHGVIAGLTLDERVYLGASGALDSRRQVVPIP
jgi:hypothetical protein